MEKIIEVQKKNIKINFNKTNSENIDDYNHFHKTSSKLNTIIFYIKIISLIILFIATITFVYKPNANKIYVILGIVIINICIIKIITSFEKSKLKTYTKNMTNMYILKDENIVRGKCYIHNSKKVKGTLIVFYNLQEDVNNELGEYKCKMIITDIRKTNHYDNVRAVIDCNGVTIYIPNL